MDLPNTRGPLVVKTTIFLKDIFEVHPKTFTLDLSLYVKLEWVDNRINVSEDGTFGVDRSFIRAIWKPDLFIWDLNGERSYSDKITMSSITVAKENQDSTVIYVLELDVNIVCAMNFSLFPFDKSTCNFRLSAFTFDDSKELEPSCHDHTFCENILLKGTFLGRLQKTSRLAAYLVQDSQL